MPTGLPVARCEGCPAVALVPLEEYRPLKTFGTWAAKQSFLKILRFSMEVQDLVKSDLQTSIFKRMPLSSVQEALDLYQKNMTSGKILLMIDPKEISL